MSLSKLLEASNGEEAVEIVNRHGGTIDFLPTDVIKPRLRGPEVAAQSWSLALRPFQIAFRPTFTLLPLCGASRRLVDWDSPAASEICENEYGLGSEVRRMVDDKKTAVRAVETGERKDRVLIVEDEENARKGYEQLLQRWGCEVLSVGSAEDALAKFGSFQPDTLIADVELPGMNGLDLLGQLGAELTDVPAIIITGKGSEERAVAAIEAGAFWYIEKPLKGPVLRALLDRALGKARDARQLVVLQRQLREAGRLGDLVGASRPMQEVMRIVEMAAPSSASVLITGETGSGKEIVARTVHKLSPRAGGPFVAINCSAIPESRNS